MNKYVNIDTIQLTLSLSLYPNLLALHKRTVVLVLGLQLLLQLQLLVIVMMMMMMMLAAELLLHCITKRRLLLANLKLHSEAQATGTMLNMRLLCGCHRWGRCCMHQGLLCNDCWRWRRRR